MISDGRNTINEESVMEKEERIQKYLSFMPEEARIPVEILEELGFFTAPASKK